MIYSDSMTNFHSRKITIEDHVAQTGTSLAQCCVDGHMDQLGVIIMDAKPDTLLC